jgi:hypothetical protein
MILNTIICHKSFTKHLSLIEILSGMAVLEVSNHLLWDCTRSRTLWIQFENWWNNTVNIQYPALTCKTILFGSFSNLPRENLYNHFILKYYMFQNKEKHIFSLVIY